MKQFLQRKQQRQTNYHTKSGDSFYTANPSPEFYKFTRQATYCAYNITLRRVRVCVSGCPSAWECEYSRACSLTYPASNAHAPYYIVICGLSGCTTFFDIISQKAQLSNEKLLNIKLCFNFLYNFCLQHFSF